MRTGTYKNTKKLVKMNQTRVHFKQMQTPRFKVHVEVRKLKKTGYTILDKQRIKQ